MSVMDNSTGKRPWLEGSPILFERRRNYSRWHYWLARHSNFTIVTPFAEGGYRIAMNIPTERQMGADLVDMGLMYAATDKNVFVSFANADCLGVVIFADGTDRKDPEFVYGNIVNMVSRRVIAGHVGDAHIDTLANVVRDHLLHHTPRTDPTLVQGFVDEVHIIRGRNFLKTWSDGNEERAAGRLARNLHERFPSACIRITGAYTEDQPLAFPTSRTRVATKAFLDEHGIASDLGDNLLERLKTMPPSLTPEYHKATGGVDFGDRHALVMEITV